MDPAKIASMALEVPGGAGLANFAGILAREDYRATILRTFWFAAIAVALIPWPWTAPAMAITVPVSADYPDQTSLTTPIEVDADDGDGWGIAVVSLKINGKLQPLTDDEAPYAFANVKFPKGSYELIAVAEDAAGLVTESLPVTINIGVVPVDPTTGGETGVTPTTSGADTNADTNADADTGGDPSAGTGVAGTETADSAPADAPSLARTRRTWMSTVRSPPS